MSVAAVAARRIDRLQLIEVDLGDGLKFLRRRGLLVLYDFQGGNDGANPPLIQDASRALYGTTIAHGPPTGIGTVIKLTPSAVGRGASTEAGLQRGSAWRAMR